jgi:hypothetical protein
MSSDENSPPASHKRQRALELGPRKKCMLRERYLWLLQLIRPLNISCGTDPLVHHGRHFGRTIHALCNVCALLNNGLLYMGELSEQPEECFTQEYVLLPSPRCLTHLPFRERQEHRVFQLLLQMIPGLEERLVEGSEENIIHVAELVCFLLATCLEHLVQFTYPDSERRFQRQI